jgi:small-conductance mechanosensitive channel
VSVVYGTDPQLVEKVLLEVAREALRDRLEGLLAQPAPSVSFIPGFGTASLDFSLGMQIRQFTDQYSVQTELRKRIVKKFRDAGIDMPVPARTRATDKPVKDAASSGSQS